MDQERARGRRSPGPAGPHARRHGTRRRGPGLVREGDQARPHSPRPAAGPDLPAQPGPEVRRGRRAVPGARPGRAQQPRHPARLGRPGAARHHQVPCPTARRPPPRSGASCSRPSPNDPVATAQVADLFRQAELVDDALALYKKAIELAPTNPQYHEYLGEYLHNLKRADEATAAWAKIADRPEQERQEPGPARRGARRLRLRQGSHRAADRGRRDRERTTSASGSSWPATPPARAV